MVDHLDDLVLFLLRSDGKQAAVMTYEEETGASRDKAVRAVERIARLHGITKTGRITGRTSLVILAVATSGILYFLLFAQP
jgi:hypothetical protein